ncbi:MAG: MerR family transcriptional regulator [Burkholderiaceae bacterium]|nr:MerR family transcriptional regulator [Burkholderiaceae bacterium]
MSEKEKPGPVGQSISDVERDTGVAKETLRVWERRYGFPVPIRDAYGQRVYAAEDLAKLRMIKRLIDLGHRPGKIVGLDPAELAELARARNDAHRKSLGRESELQTCIGLCGSHRIEDLRFKLTELMLQMGLHAFVVDFLADLNVMVGEAWAAGRIAVFEEHLYTESVQVVMRQAIASIPQKREGELAPRVLLTTLPQERHGLGLLMVEALAALEGAACISLGVQTPVEDIARAARQHRTDIVALSFSLSMRPNQVLDGLRELRAMLPENIDIWAGGSATVLKKRPPDGAKVLQLTSVAAELKAWRAGHAAQD